jgi:hypothetical protein
MKSISVSETALQERKTGASELLPRIFAAVSVPSVAQEQTVQKIEQITASKQ